MQSLCQKQSTVKRKTIEIDRTSAWSSPTSKIDYFIMLICCNFCGLSTDLDIYLFLGILIQAYMPDDGGLQELGIADPNFISRRYLPVGGVGVHQGL